MTDPKNEDPNAPGITRRDFVGGTLLGTGTALLGMSAPGALRQAAAQTMPSPMTGLGADWTGPGGIGDYASSNGNTFAVVNEAHGAIRNHERDGGLRTAHDTGEVFDVVVVGAGIAGLSACFTINRHHPKATVLVLDQHPIFGGEAKQNEFEVDGYHLTAPQGSTGIVVPFSTAKNANFYSHFCTDLGFPDEFVFQEPTGLSSEIKVPHDAWFPMHLGWEKSDAGFYYEGKGWVKNPWRNGFRDAPLSEATKKAFLEWDLYRTPPERKDWPQWLDTMTYEQFMRDEMGLAGEPLEEIKRYIDPVAAAQGCGLGSDVISAYSAYTFMVPGVVPFYRAANHGADPTDQLYLASFPGGNSGTARCFVKKAIPAAFKGEYNLADILTSPVQWDQLDNPNQPVRMRLSSTVIAITNVERSAGLGATVTYSKGGKLYRVTGKTVVCAGQQHVNRHILRDIPDEYRSAMATFHHAPMMTINVAVRNWKFLDKLGIASARWFDGFGWWISLRRNLEIDGQQTMPLDPAKPFVFQMYNPFVIPGLPAEQQCTAARMQLFGMPFKDIEAAVRTQFTKLFGDYGFDATRDIAGIIANRWGHAYVVSPPGFYYGKDGKPAPKDIIRKRYERVAFGHSELTGQQMWETAADEGERAAKQVLEIL